MTREVVLLGSTGSVGTQAIDVVRQRRTGSGWSVWPPAAAGPTCSPRRRIELGVEVVAVAQAVGVRRRAAGAVRRGAAARLQPRRLRDAEAAGRVRTPPTEVAAWPCDIVLNGMTGSVGLAPTLAALEAGRTLALANKESLIAGGPLVAAIAQARPDRPGRLRALRDRAVPARRGRRARSAGSC